MAASQPLGPLWLLFLISGAQLTRAASPLQQAFRLIEGLRDEVRKDGRAEAQAYDRFACFCKHKNGMVSEQIMREQDNIDRLSARMASKDADRVEAQSDAQEAAGLIEVLSKKLEETKVKCEKEKAEGEAKNRELEKGMKIIVDAYNNLVENYNAAPMTMKLLEIKRSPEVAGALKVLDGGARWHSDFEALLQETSKQSPEDPNYKFRSRGILKLMRDLRGQVAEQRNEVIKDLREAMQRCNSVINNVTNSLFMAKQRLESANVRKMRAEQDLAKLREYLLEEHTSLKDDQKYLKDLTLMCETRAKDWDQRAKMRADEQDALEQCLAVLVINTSMVEHVNERAFVQVRKDPPTVAPPEQPRRRPGIPAILLQQRSSRRLKRAATRSSEDAVRVQKALEVLGKEGKALKSSTLQALSIHVASTGPMDKVMDLIHDVIGRLQREGLAETNKNGFCNTEMGKAEQERGYRFEEVQQLNADLRMMESKEEGLAMGIQEMQTELGKLRSALAEATDARAAEKSVNQETLETAKFGLHSLRDAKAFIEDFYRKAKHVTSLAQVASTQSPEQDAPDPGFNGGYNGKQEASKGALASLEVVEEDFQRTIRRTEEAEEEAAAAFREFRQATEADISGKSTQSELDSEELKKTSAAILTNKQEMEDNMVLVDKALAQLEALKPTCVDKGMSHEERMRQRQREMDALRTVLQILNM